MPTRTFRYDPESTMGIIFSIKVWQEVEFDCEDISEQETEIGGWNHWPIGVTSYYNINVSMEKKKKVPCDIPNCTNGVKWEFTLRYNIYLVGDVGIGSLDADFDTTDPVQEFADFTTECICCD